MSRTRYLLAFAALLCFVPTLTRAADLIAPERGTVMTLVIGGKQSTYYRLSADTASYLTVNGPARLTFLVRLVPPAPKAGTIEYTMVVSSDNEILKTATTTTEPIEWHWLNSDYGVCKSRKFSVVVPEGSHHLKVGLRNTSAKLAGVRYLLGSSAPHGGESSLYPVGKVTAATLLLKEKPLDYFVATADHPVHVRVVGPTRLRVVTRLIYTGTMKGSQRYALDVRQDSQQVPAEALITRKSLAATFPDHPEWNVGQSRTVYFPIPDGEHNVVLKPTGTDAPGVVMRFTIPKEDIVNEADE